MKGIERSYQRSSHRARFTDDYIFSQLIPYIGNKRKLLPLIGRALQATGVRKGTFVDLFTGSTVVARWAKTLGYRVLANDFEPYSHRIALGTVVPNRPPAFDRLGGPEAVFDRLNSLPGREGWVSQHLCPRDDEKPDPDRERMFFTRANGARIDAVRGRIASWRRQQLISAAEEAFLLAPLLYSVCYASNTSGVFKAFHHGWGGKTQSALYRILAPLELQPPVLHDNGQDNLAACRDAIELAPELPQVLGGRPDVVYLDPPYNQHPYGSNYHVLNSVTLWDRPKLQPLHRVNGCSRDKAAIRRDWQRTPFNSPRSAAGALRELLDRIDARWILLSYSTDGLIPRPDLLDIARSRGPVRSVRQSYRRYRVSSQRRSPRSHTIEFVLLIEAAPARSRLTPPRGIAR